MIKNFIFFILLMVSANVILCEPVTVTGVIPGGAGYEIRLIGYTDLISNTSVILDRTIIDSMDTFKLETDINEIQLTYLDLDYYDNVLYIEPGKDYHLLFEQINMVNQYRPFYEKESMIYELIPDNPDELNGLIFDFNENFNTFLIDHFQEIYTKRKKSLIETFRLETEMKYAPINQKYFKDHIDYKVASVELSANPGNKSELFNKYLNGKPVLYFNGAYMSFFNQFFEQYLTVANKFVKRKDIESAVNDQKSVTALMDTLGKDTLLLSESFRELVMLKGLEELYFSPYYYQQNILSMLNVVAASSHFPMHRTIASNIKASLTRLQKGTFAPDFILMSTENDSMQLSAFQGKPVYLSFLTTWSNACLAEFEILDSLYRVWGSKINFITVSLDNNIEIIARYKKEKNLNWTFLYNGTRYDLIEDYGIKTFPLFVLISKDGKILQYPAEKPSEGIGDTMDKLTMRN